MASRMNSVDEGVAAVFVSIGQRLSRRGLLSLCGRALMWTAGVSTIAPLLPVNRVSAQSIGCGDWRLCGIYGNLCGNCCGQGAQLFGCPQCTNPGSYWNGCCLVPASCPPIHRYYRYVDCCGVKPPYSDGAAAECQSTPCPNGPPQPAWCSGLGTYRCTYIQEVGGCG